MLADMIELMEDHRAMRMDGVGDLAEMRDDLIGRMAEIAAGQDGGAMHRHRLDHDHRRTAAGALLVIAAMALAAAGPSSDMLAVWAPKTMRLRRVLWRRFSGWKRWGKAVGMGAFSPSRGPPAMGLLKSARACADQHKHPCRERVESLSPVCPPIIGEKSCGVFLVPCPHRVHRRPRHAGASRICRKVRRKSPLATARRICLPMLIASRGQSPWQLE